MGGTPSRAVFLAAVALAAGARVGLAAVDHHGQVLFGGIHSSFGVTGGTSGSANAFGMKLGGGLDWNVSPKFGVRLGQFNYDFSHFGGQTQNNFDYSAGAVFHFGK